MICHACTPVAGYALGFVSGILFFAIVVGCLIEYAANAEKKVKS